MPTALWQPRYHVRVPGLIRKGTRPRRKDLIDPGCGPGTLRLLYRNLTAGRHRHGEYASAQERHAN